MVLGRFAFKLLFGTALVVLGMGLVGCGSGCNIDGANNCIADVQSRAKLDISNGNIDLCRSIGDLLKCIKVNSCCDDDEQKLVIESWRDAPYNCKTIGDC